VHDGRPAPRWATVAAHLVAAVTLPSGLWRVGLALGFSMGMLDAGAPAHVHGAESVSVVGLSVVSEGVALLTLGLVRPWGERVPAWIPGIGGRWIAPFAVIVPAAVGALALAAIWAFAFRDFPSPPGLHFAGAGWKALMLACYLPLLAWAPLLAVVTWAYWRRRCRA
jgi:hypothetical protein